MLDLSEGVAGGYCTKLFGCLGAEVIKVEDPAGGDISRRMGPFLDYLPDPETSATYLYLNTNKKSITLNLSTTSGVETLKTLIPSADVVVETYMPGTMEERGMGYEVLEEINPGVALASITYFGQTGPYRDYKGNSMVGFALTGQMHMTGEADQAPLVGAGFQPEYTAGIHAFDAAMAALYWRDSSGKGPARRRIRDGGDGLLPRVCDYDVDSPAGEEHSNRERLSGRGASSDDVRMQGRMGVDKQRYAAPQRESVPDDGKGPT